MAKGKLTETERVETESRKELMDSVPKILVYGGTALLIWLFSKLVFIKLGNAYNITSDITAGYIIAVIAILVVLWVVLKVLKEVKDVCDAVGGLIAVNAGRGGASEEEVENWRKAIRGVAYVIVVAVAFIFFASLLTEIGDFVGEVAAGVLLIGIFIWAAYTLYKSGMAVSKEVEARALEWEKKTLLKEAKD
ncbi:MAG: hypothetical protein A7316_02915 [Candidatus Altiarchaeales archaeon WOR_SM1_86-2]|nr:MAG: hypothetical protein A7316_02915 [Candidatus Altiarchaeales archaeon WOR_SM1_86-2]ODS40822.1 MAG: hypothetical protein A7315_07595 [Candidatus Altiarchaeales archaeon WOR_SM1_79]